MRKFAIVVWLLLFGTYGFPTMSQAAESNGAQIEKVEGCNADDETGIVTCFEAHIVRHESRGVYIDMFRGANFYLGGAETDPYTLEVRSHLVVVHTGQGAEQVYTYFAHAKISLPHLICNDDVRFHISNGEVRIDSFVSDCVPV